MKWILSFLIVVVSLLAAGRPMLVSTIENGICREAVFGRREAWFPPTARSVSLGIWIDASTAQQAPIMKAAQEWARYARVAWYWSSQGAPYTIEVRFVPIDGPGKKVGQAYFPPPFVDEPNAGNIELDSAENWTPDLLYDVSLHEIGHALGLFHNTNEDSVMFWLLRRPGKITLWDILSVGEIFLLCPYLPTPTNPVLQNKP